MAKKAFIVVPAQANDRTQFRDSALELRRRVYPSPETIIVKAVMVGTPEHGTLELRTVALSGIVNPEGGSPCPLPCNGTWDAVITMSHIGPKDGPNWNYLAPGVGTFQPWRQPAEGQLTEAGTLFWSQAGWTVHAQGKIMLLGCNSATKNYCDLVANISQRVTYGTTSSFGSADARTCLPVVTEIENGSCPSPMRRCFPTMQYGYRPVPRAYAWGWRPALARVG
jgi:hypothetical protein